MGTKFITNKGFTLIEVLMALTVFSVFIVVFMGTQGYNIHSSMRMKEELILHNLAELKLNESILNPPELNESKSEVIEEKNFEDTNYEEYKYKIVFKKVELPNFISLADDDSEGNTKELEKKIIDKLKENLEKLVWQVQVSITNKTTGETYSLSSWVNNPNGKIKLDFNI